MREKGCNLKKDVLLFFQLHRIVTVRQAKPELTADLWGNSRFFYFGMRENDGYWKNIE
ncbi:hypothetical protein ACK4CS_16470 [Enterococcus gallinarum]|uniref:Uncharacterized protein n=1 Tax=Enterococcus gallinarum TaxID=1353 RepID=A0AAE4KXF2_ENTGA|nr:MULTISPECIES: hypothetical protein [Enterococcus]MBF0822480.1 hypothetical protein [Enterococcus faecalis]MBA0968862.1 hypothetical protein [Enterococcus gallinarum]MBA0972148.1 hypothetical protein [Enterococcus gallinarum]MBF0796694.1 hypothetical protein [Enterococcus gallinarum]MCD5186700.1 hypothetical protein [Enterococcus gallinarum]